MDSGVRDSKVNPIGILRSDGGNNDVQDKNKRKVQWNDTQGNQLAEIMEFLPSDVSEIAHQETESCLCTIM